MRKTVRNLIVAIACIAVVIVAAYALVTRRTGVKIEKALAAYQKNSRCADLTITYPNDQTLFPPEIVPPTFCWKDGNPKANAWVISLNFQDANNPMNFLSGSKTWTPTSSQWNQIKNRSLEKNARVTILGINSPEPESIISAGKVVIMTSKDQVGAPLFYREVNLPFVDAVMDPSRIRWRFGPISSPKPPVVLTGLPVCGNCHSFNRTGKTLAMDIDYANSKGSYVIAEIAEDMTLATSDVITWDDYKKNDGELTFGLLSQISPDGRYVVSTVKDESVFVPRPPLAFSQLFFPVKGILCIYDRQQRTFSALPGADDPNYVQSNPTWSPDGEYILFARADAYKLKKKDDKHTVLLSADECKEFLEEGKPFKFDLYKIPFNEGKGGEPEPIEGASNNDMSNFFARYSPDGKWIVFCKAANYMLLQPDSELYIVSAEGGQPKKMRCNTSLMNSWHSWSPNSKWLVFSSKVNSPYTQLFLTHIDDQGQSSPPVLLSHLTSPDRAANIPEFVNADPTAIRKIREQFVDDLSYVRAANECLKAEDYKGVENWCKKALALNPRNSEAHHNIGVALASREDFDQAVKHWLQAVEINPNYVEAYYNLGQAMCRQNQLDQAINYWSKVLQLKPDHVKAHGNIGAVLFTKGVLDQAVSHLSQAIQLDPNNGEAHYNLGKAMFNQGKLQQALDHFSKVISLRPRDTEAHYNIGVILTRAEKTDDATRFFLKTIELNPNHAEAHYNLGVSFARQGSINEAMKHWLEAIRIDPDSISTLLSLTAGYAQSGQFQQAIATAQKALVRARQVGDEKLVVKLQQSIEQYKNAGASQLK